MKNDIFIKSWFEDELACEECFRVLPNDKFFTKKGCIWCTVPTKKEKNERKYK